MLSVNEVGITNMTKQYTVLLSWAKYIVVQYVAWNYYKSTIITDSESSLINAVLIFLMSVLFWKPSNTM